MVCFLGREVLRVGVMYSEEVRGAALLKQLHGIATYARVEHVGLGWKHNVVLPVLIDAQVAAKPKQRLAGGAGITFTVHPKTRLCRRLSNCSCDHISKSFCVIT